MRDFPELTGAILVALLIAHAPVWAQPAAVRMVVAAGQPAPGGGAFEHFSVESQPVVAPVNARGEVAFFATLVRARGSEGLFLASPRGLTKVVVEGDRAPGGGALSGFGRHPIPSINAAASVAFAAAVSGGKTVEGIFVSSRGALTAVAVAGQPAPGISSGTFANLDFPALNDRGDVAFLATVRRGRETVEAIYLRAGDRLRKVVAQEDPAPAGGSFAGFGAPALNSAGVVAFAAVVEGRGVPGGLFAVAGGQTKMLVGAGDESPAGGIFAKFSERLALDDSGAVAFTSMLKDGPARAAIFLTEGARARKLVGLGDQAPGGAFSSFGLWPALSASGDVAFTASIDPGPPATAVFVVGRAGTRQVAAIGDSLAGSGTLASFGLYPTVTMGPAGHLTFATAPTATGEGAEGIFIADPAPGR
ncbi:MAG TPA: choice-of-anchor tandem repeat NxxGxxAF-containing protein [Candidatus Methylomirabilis sp.]|nr:choice-of-anchor tandem repeat NxxGxxAF-containing protein [Candidatus Methylomirabilis sp.]